MGILSDLVKPGEYSLADWGRDLRSAITGTKTSAGVNVSEDSALKFATVYSCVRVLSESLGQLPFVTLKRRPGRGSDQVRDHPVFGLLHDQPNDEMASVTWRESQQGNLALSGNCFSILSHDGRGRVKDIYPVDWHMMRTVRNPSSRRIEYWVNDRGKPDVFPAEKVLHIPLFGDGILGHSPIGMAREAIGIGVAAARFAAHFYGQGMNVGGVLEHPTKLDDKAYERLKSSIEEEFSGLQNSWRPLLLEDGMKYARIPMPLNEAQFVETRKFSRDEICGLFRVPPHMIANLERSTNNNIEHQGLEFVMYTLMPYVVKWEQECNRKLFTRAEREAGHYVKLNVTALLRGDYKSRQEGLAIMRQNGVISANDWLDLEDMNPQDGATGDMYYINSAMAPVGEGGALGA